MKPKRRHRLPDVFVEPDDRGVAKTLLRMRATTTEDTRRKSPGVSADVFSTPADTV
jgi:hypothetical protein